MAYPYTETGYNMFDMLSMIQKAIRRGDYEHAGFAANQLRGRYRSTMWNRIYVITAEDCYGVLTKEIVALRKQDEAFPNDQNISNAVALMCRSKKSRDACYFACNFVLANRKPRDLKPTEKQVEDFHHRMCELSEKTKGGKSAAKTISYDEFGFGQMTMGDEGSDRESGNDLTEYQKAAALAGATMQLAMKHRDMDMIGYQVNVIRQMDRELLWNILIDYAIINCPPLVSEILALRVADDVVNKRRKTLEKDEIFISKSIMLLSYFENERFDTALSSNAVEYENIIDWSKNNVKPLEECRLRGTGIPEWVYDCHTLKGKKMGKTDWDMTTTEQAALYPLQDDYFSYASWLPIYEQDVETGVLTEEGMKPIREFAKTHEANPVRFIPYE